MSMMFSFCFCFAQPAVTFPILLCPQNKMLKDQNLILKKNISSLYLTAREEIQRKDNQIKMLQDKDTKQRLRRAQSSKET